MIAKTERHSNESASFHNGTGPDVGWNKKGRIPSPANDIGPRPTVAAFPPGTAAWICRPAKLPGTSGTANVCQWLLEFEPAVRPSIDPLTGWYGGGDTLQQVQLRFPSKEAAIDYARRHGLSFTLQDEAPGALSRCPAERAIAVPSHWTVFRAMDEPAVALVDMDLALTNPARVFASPWEVVVHPALTDAQRRQILKRWEWDARLIETADTEAMPQGEPSRLEEVLDALAAVRGWQANARAAANENRESTGTLTAT